MRDPERIPEILKALRVYWVTYPHLRLGQLVDNLARREGGEDPFFFEDDALLEALWRGVKEGGGNG